MGIIRTESLTYSYTTYEGETAAALNGIDLDIEKGRFTAILGRNGSGKSTLAKHINALLRPTGGTVWVNGADTKDNAHVWGVRQSAGMVFQNPDNQIIATIVEEDIAFGPENLGVPPAQIRERVDTALNAVEMGEYRRAAPHHLSGGQKQRVAIAGVLAMKPSCIVLDEPTAMLDPSGRREVIDTVMRLNKDEGISVILITHFMEEAVRADRVIVMDAGKVAMDGAPREVFRQPQKLKDLGLDAPQATELAHMLNASLGMDALPCDLLTMDELAAALNSAAVTKDAGVSAGTKKKPETGDKKFERGAAQNASRPLLELKNISYVYNPGSAFEKKALDNVSLSIHRGEFIAIIGHTGSGKSTLAQHFNALLKPSSGQVVFDGEVIGAEKKAGKKQGQKIDKKKLKQARQRVGLVFQYPEHQLFELTVLKDVAFGPENMGLPSSEAEKRAKEALAAVGIDEEFFEKSPFELSGGQKRRAAIAGALAMRPEILVLDEPAAGLDPKGRDEILEQVRAMHQTLNLTVILVSHSMEDVARLAGRIVVVSHGRVEYDGCPGEVFSHVGELEQMGLAAPRTAYLMRELRRSGWSVPDGVFTPVEAAAVLAPCLKGEA